MSRVIVTRTREQSGSLSEKLTGLGYEAIEVPTIKTVSLMADEQLKKAFSRHKYDWIFFTSHNGVNEFGSFLNRMGKDSRIFGEAKICAIGSETAKSLRGIGIEPDYMPFQFVSEAIVEHFKNMSFKSLVAPKALILRAKKARDILPVELKKAGFLVKTIDLYDTVMPEESALIIKEAFKRRIDFVTFTSSSTVENFIKLLGESYIRRLFGVKIVSIGPVTSGTLKKFGLKIDAEAKTHTIDGLVTAVKFCEERVKT